MLHEWGEVEYTYVYGGKARKKEITIETKMQVVI
jgi:hypothetical protein